MDDDMRELAGRLSRQVLLCEFDSPDEAERITVLLGQCGVIARSVEKGGSFEVWVPERDIAFCSEVMDAIRKGQFDLDCGDLRDMIAMASDRDKVDDFLDGFEGGGGNQDMKGRALLIAAAVAVPMLIIYILLMK